MSEVEPAPVLKPVPITEADLSLSSRLRINRLCESNLDRYPGINGLRIQAADRDNSQRALEDIRARHAAGHEAVYAFLDNSGAIRAIGQIVPGGPVALRAPISRTAEFYMRGVGGPLAFKTVVESGAGLLRFFNVALPKGLSPFVMALTEPEDRSRIAEIYADLLQIAKKDWLTGSLRAWTAEPASNTQVIQELKKACFTEIDERYLVGRGIMRTAKPVRYNLFGHVPFIKGSME